MTRSERAAQLWALLAVAARNRQVLTYRIVAGAIGVPLPAVGGFLEPVQSYCIKKHLPPLTALVVGEGSGMPGEGFIAAENIPRAQAQVFSEDWLARNAPSPEDLESAFREHSADKNQ